MSWLNSILVTLTSVEPYKVPVTVIVTVTFAFVCFIFFYLLRSIRIIYGLKKYTRSINSIEKVRQRFSLNTLRACFSGLNSSMRGMSSKNRCTHNMNWRTAKRKSSVFGLLRRAPASSRSNNWSIFR